MLRLREASHDTAGAVLPSPSYKTLAVERVAGRPGFAGPGAACQCGTSRPRPGLRPPPARHTRCSLIHQSQRKRPEMLKEPLPGRTQNTRSGAARTTCRPTGTCRQIGGSLRGSVKTEITVRDGLHRRLRPQAAEFAARERPRGAPRRRSCRADDARPCRRQKRIFTPSLMMHKYTSQTTIYSGQTGTAERSAGALVTARRLADMSGERLADGRQPKRADRIIMRCLCSMGLHAVAVQEIKRQWAWRSSSSSSKPRTRLDLVADGPHLIEGEPGGSGRSRSR